MRPVIGMATGGKPVRLIAFAVVPPSLQSRAALRHRCVQVVPRRTTNACVVQRRALWFNAIPSSTDSEGKDASEVSDDVVRKRASGTLVGRIIVEVLALFVGVTLLLIVAAWKALNVVWLYLWKALMWLSNVRRLGHWACVRTATLCSTLTSSPSKVSELVLVPMRSAISALWSVFPIGKSRHVTVRSANVVDDDELVSKRDLVDVQMEIEKMKDMIDSGSRSSSAAVSEPSSREQICKEAVADTIPYVNSISTDKSRLILLRHARSSWDQAGEVDDHERVLTERGKIEARLVGKELRERGWFPDVILCSGSKRTTQTLELLSPENYSGQRLDVEGAIFTDSLYFAVRGTEMASTVDEQVPEEGLRLGKTTLVVCHSPGCEELVECLTGQKPEIGTACAALLEYSVTYRSEVQKKGEAENIRLRLSQGQKQWELVDVIRPTSLH